MSLTRAVFLLLPSLLLRLHSCRRISAWRSASFTCSRSTSVEFSTDFTISGMSLLRVWSCSPERTATRTRQDTARRQAIGTGHRECPSSLSNCDRISSRCFGGLVLRFADVFSVYVTKLNVLGHFDNGKAKCNRSDIYDCWALWRPEVVVVVGVARFGRLLMFVDSDTREVLGRRGDQDTVATGFECIEEIVCKGERFIEFSLRRNYVDQEPFVGPAMLPSSTLYPES